MVTSLVLAAVGLTSVSPTKSLEVEFEKLCSGFQGKIGYHLKLLPDGPEISRLGATKFPTASTIKTALLIEAINQVDEGTIKWTDQREVPPTASRTSNMASMWSYFLKDGTKIDLDGWCNLMIGVSDNTATKVLALWLDATKVRTRMQSFGLEQTAFLSYTPQDPFLKRWNMHYGMGMTTPDEMAKLWELIYLRKVASPGGCDRIIRILGRQYWDDYLASGVPPTVKVLSKTGAISRSRSDNAIVYGDQHYLFIVYTDQQKDQSWGDHNEGEELIRKMGSLAWNTLNPKHPYTPPADAKKFAPTGGGIE
ncbi:MAG: serine hydrolase [Armatimonadetes bacterium]|nr:serine hydrolase [Armatimonadota bacterium]